MKTLPYATLLALASALPGVADLVVDLDLGTLPFGDTPLSGTTAQVTNPAPPPATIGGNNNSDFVVGFTNPAWVYGTEIVYQFTLSEPAIITIRKDTDFTEDPDFFILRNLSTSVDAGNGKTTPDGVLAAVFLDPPAPISETLGGFKEGTYYLLVDSWSGSGNVGEVPLLDAVFDVVISVDLAFLPEEVAIDLGPIAPEGSPLSFDTFGSNFDTELAIYTAFGEVVESPVGSRLENDDAAGGQQSAISIPQGLPAGGYYVAVAGHDVTFGFGPSITTGGAVGDIVLNFDVGPNLPPAQELARTSAGSEIRETQFFSFSIFSPPPSTLLGTIANAGDPFFIDFFGSLFDTEMGVFDSFGFLQFTNDDGVGGVLQSRVDFPTGLAAGTWYVALIGYNGAFGDGFGVQEGAAGGSFVLNHPEGSVSGVLNTPETVWFSFEVGAAPVAPGIDITSIQFNEVNDEFIIAWKSSAPGPFNILMGSEMELAALTAAPNNLLPTTVAVGVTSPLTIQIPPALQGEGKVFLQVTD